MRFDNTAVTGHSQTSSPDRRHGSDRRTHTLKTLCYCGFSGSGRRRSARREEHNYYLDHYAGGLVATGVMVLLLSCLDALLTLSLLDKGAYEANQFMAHMLNLSVHHFIITKVAITAAGILFLLMHAHFRILSVLNGKRALQLLVIAYSLLIGWEIFLLVILP